MKTIKGSFIIYSGLPLEDNYKMLKTLAYIVLSTLVMFPVNTVFLYESEMRGFGLFFVDVELGECKTPILDNLINNKC